MGLRGGGAPALLGLVPACNLRPPRPRLPPPAVLLELGSGGGGGSGSFRLPAGPHKKASEGSAAKPQLTPRVSGGARGVLWTSGASQRPFSRADSIYSISVVRMILLTRPTSDLVKSLKQKTDR